MALPPRRDLVRRFWLAYLAGATKEEAAQGLGLNRNTGPTWFRQAGGVVPAYVKAKASGRKLSLGEREEIFAGVERGDSIRCIARALGRAPSTVLRELRHNMWHQLYRARHRRPHGFPVTKPWNYRPSLAQRRADAMARRPKAAKLATNFVLHELVQAKLTARRSPEQIAAQLKRQFPDQPEMWVSHETIYQSIYVQGRGALRRELAICLRTGRALRRPHRKAEQRRGRIPGMVSISERPAEVQDRAVPGHWEGDLLMGTEGKSAIATLVERQTRYVMLAKLPGDHKTAPVIQALKDRIQQLPAHLILSLTWDQGRELAAHKQFSIDTGV